MHWIESEISNFLPPHFLGPFCIRHALLKKRKVCLCTMQNQCNHRVMQTACMLVSGGKVLFSSFDYLGNRWRQKTQVFLFIRCSWVFSLGFQNACSGLFSLLWGLVPCLGRHAVTVKKVPLISSPPCVHLHTHLPTEISSYHFSNSNSSTSLF